MAAARPDDRADLHGGGAGVRLRAGNVAGCCARHLCAPGGGRQGPAARGGRGAGAARGRRAPARAAAPEVPGRPRRGCRDGGGAGRELAPAPGPAPARAGRDVQRAAGRVAVSRSRFPWILAGILLFSLAAWGVTGLVLAALVLSAAYGA